MRVPRIHTNQPLVAGSRLELEPEPSRHIGRALRMQPGDHIILFNGDGYEYPSQIAVLGKKNASVDIVEQLSRNLESTLHIHIGIGLSRGDRMDWVIQKATELGVTRISPLFTERSEVKLKGERELKKWRHWQQIAISACEQSGRNRVPDIAHCETISSWVEQVEADRKFVLHHRSGAATDKREIPTDIALLIGPEGGLSEGEISAAETSGFTPLTLGPRVLRTETAPLAAIAILQARWGDMSALV